MSANPDPKRSADEVGAFPPRPTDSTLKQDPTLLEQLNDLDRDMYTAIARSHTPALDEPLRRLSNAANCSRVHTGVHYPGDVLVESTLGIVAGSITATTVRPLERRHLHH